MDIAEDVITKNIHRVSIYLQEIEKNLVANDLAKNNSKLLVFERVEDELAWLVEEIRGILANGTADREVAILCRTNKQVRQIAEYFDKFEMRYRLEAGESIFDVVQIQQLILLLHVVSNPLDDVKVFSLLHTKFLGLKALDVVRMHNAVLNEINEEKRRRHYFDALRDQEFLHVAKVSLPDSFLTFAVKLENWIEQKNNVTLPILIEQVVRECGILEFADKHADRLIILSALKVFVEVAHEFYQVHSDGDLVELLSYIEEHKLHEVPIPYFMSSIDGVGVRILTAHKSKGLEYEYVFLPQCTDANWGANRVRELIKLPPQMIAYDTTILSKQEIEDERRLFYVAITRTKKNLNISFAKMNEQSKVASPSRFIGEIDELKLEKVEMSDYRGDRLFIPAKLGVRERNLAEDLVESRLRELRLTATNVNDYLSCPRLFYYRHFLRAPIIKNKYMALGTAVHEAIESLYRQQMRLDGKEGRLPEKEEILDVFEKKLWKELAYQKEYEDTLQKGKGFLGKYYDYYKDKLVQPLYIEYDFFGDHVMLEEIPLSGKVDMIELIEPLTRRVAFYDFKTGKPEVKLREIAHGGTIWRQMVFYELLASLSGRFSGKYKLKKSVVDFVEPNEEGDFVRKELIISEDECEIVREEIRKVWSGVKKLEFECISGNATCDACKEVLLFAIEE
ncbi:MAG: hypothetical protein KatS3mg087_0801 [Patescibacteria group bacterium]|nr:MAG: hypothetical protein KatS3mg087_0801 [Patescibacteria group bacterium]